MMELTKEKLVKFFEEVDSDFNPPLSQKTDLSLFANKLLECASLFYESSDSGDVAGLVAIYANDFEKKYAYIPLVAVSPLYRRQGIGEKLLRESLDYINSLDGKIQTVGIHTSNPVALTLYYKFGFKLVSTSDNRNYLEKKV